VQPLRGDLESPSVARVRARAVGPTGHRRHATFIVKHLNGLARREIGAYESLRVAFGGGTARLIGNEPVSTDDSYVYLESITPFRRWPWGDPVLAGLVLKQLATLHKAELPVERHTSRKDAPPDHIRSRRCGRDG
jgi:hypothetical protein